MRLAAMTIIIKFLPQDIGKMRRFSRAIGPVLPQLRGHIRLFSAGVDLRPSPRRIRPLADL